MRYQVETRQDVRHDLFNGDETITLVIVSGDWFTVEIHWTQNTFEGITWRDETFNRCGWIAGVERGRSWDEVQEEVISTLFPDCTMAHIVNGLLEFGPGI